jgi:hypothetical protein
MDGFSDIGFESRGGNWDWRKRGISLPMLPNAENNMAAFL